MTVATEQVLREALRLTPVERAELIDELFQSFDGTTDPAVDAAWAEEVESRIAAYDAGLLKADSAEAVQDRISRR
jgi:putative addiction module component (TIGR02574 family)